ncbi:MAG: hypothetical protein NTX50_26160 [Candidatus Sumerlaeota bacterium]|nr:hypothetical protein [Candidatus Sumerlaeota bacterium]
MLWQLLKKEFRLQRSSLFFALGIVLLWAVMMALTPMAGRVLVRNQLTLGQLLNFIQACLIGPAMIGLVPLMLGAGMVAEERRLGVWDWHLSLPAPRWMQWTVKLAFGAAVTLALVFIVQPLMDAGLGWALRSCSELIPQPSAYLSFNPAYCFLPLLLMASGAFVSSLTSDPYKAFFCGLPLFFAVLGLTCLADPAHLLLLPWLSKDAQMNLIARIYISLQAIGLAAILAWLAWFNFRFEAFRWHRLAGQLLAMVLLIVALTDWTLRMGFSPARNFSQNKADVEPYIMVQSRAVTDSGKPAPVQWAGIEPLLVKRPGIIYGYYMSPNESKLFGALYRLPGANRIIAEVKTFPVSHGNQIMSQQIMEIEVDTKRIRAVYQTPGQVEFINAKTGAYAIAWMGRFFMKPNWPVPLPEYIVNSFAKPGWKNDLQETRDELFHSASKAFKHLRSDERSRELDFIPLTNPKNGFYAIHRKSPNEYVSWLVRRLPDSRWTEVDKANHRVWYSISNDGKWFTRRAYSQFDTDALTLMAVDHSSTYTIRNPDGALLLAGREFRDMNADFGQIGAHATELQVSPSGRYLCFLRTKTIKVKDMDGQMVDTGYPESVGFRLLDLRDGRELTLENCSPSYEVLRKFEDEMKGWLWGKWDYEKRERKEIDKDNERRLVLLPRNYQCWIPMVWAPDRDRLARFHDDTIFVYDCSDELMYKTKEIPSAPLFETPTNFLHSGIVFLPGFQIRNLDFWDADTIVAWGDLGMFRIDWKKAAMAWTVTKP